MAYLTIQIDKKVIAERELADAVVLGRSPDCDLHIDSHVMSRRHLRLERLSQGWCATDLRSTNGSTVNGKPITTYFLQDGDRIHVKNITLTFRHQRGVGSSIHEDEILDILNAREDDSVDELPTELTGETLVEQKAIETPAEQEPAIVRPRAAARSQQNHPRDLWQMANTSTPADAKPAITVGSANTTTRPAQKKQQSSVRSFWAELRADPRRFKKFAIAAGLAASLMLAGIFWIGSGPSMPRYDAARPITATPVQTPGHDSLADNPV